jgi:hypothetical protein
MLFLLISSVLVKVTENKWWNVDDDAWLVRILLSICVSGKLNGWVEFEMMSTVAVQTLFFQNPEIWTASRLCLFAWEIYYFIAMPCYRVPRLPAILTVSLNFPRYYKYATAGFIWLFKSFYFIILFHLVTQTYKNHNSFISNPKFMKFFPLCSAWCLLFYHNFFWIFGWSNFEWH